LEHNTQSKNWGVKGEKKLNRKGKGGGKLGVKKSSQNGLVDLKAWVGGRKTWEAIEKEVGENKCN